MAANRHYLVLVCNIWDQFSGLEQPLANRVMENMHKLLKVADELNDINEALGFVGQSTGEPGAGVVLTLVQDRLRDQERIIKEVINGLNKKLAA
jgi:hypothetical protein